MMTWSPQGSMDNFEKLKCVLMHFKDGVLLLDPANRILLINPPFCHAFNLEQEDLLGKSLMEVLPHPDVRTILETSEEEPIPHHEITLDDGRIFYAQRTTIPGFGLALTIQDISYFKQLDRLKSEFVHTVSHDLRSPLTAILGYIELIERVGPINTQQKEYIQRVQTSVRNITNLVDDLLDLGRIEAGLDVFKEIIPLDSLIKISVDMLNDQIGVKKQRLEMSVPDPSPKWYGNPVRLRQMLDNLIGNAIKYTPKGGTIRISVEEQGDQIILRVSDTGRGIPLGEQAHIFDKFYRASNIPESVEGTGLGLAIVKSIIDNHGGRIWVESALDEGSTFTVVIPAYIPR